MEQRMDETSKWTMQNNSRNVVLTVPPLTHMQPHRSADRLAAAAKRRLAPSIRTDRNTDSWTSVRPHRASDGPVKLSGHVAPKIGQNWLHEFTTLGS